MVSLLYNIKQFTISLKVSACQYVSERMKAIWFINAGYWFNINLAQLTMNHPVWQFLSGKAQLNPRWIDFHAFELRRIPLYWYLEEKEKVLSIESWHKSYRMPSEFKIDYERKLCMKKIYFKLRSRNRSSQTRNR